MRKASLVLILAVFYVSSVCRCNFTSRFQEHKGYDLKDTCERNITHTRNYPNITKVTLRSEVSLKNSKFSSSNIFEAWKNFPIEIFTNSANISSGCRKEFQKYHMAVLKNELHALKMFDATAKLPAGLLRGNVNQYGDFDQCMEIPDAQYCLADIDISSVWTKSLSNYKDLVHSHFSIKEGFDDPGHRIPGFSFVKWGFCIPKSCTSIDLSRALKEKLTVKARVRAGLCQISSKVKNKLTFGDYLARIYLGLVFLAVTLSTMLWNTLDFSQAVKKWDIKVKTAAQRSIFDSNSNTNTMLKMGHRVDRKCPPIQEYRSEQGATHPGNYYSCLGYTQKYLDICGFKILKSFSLQYNYGQLIRPSEKKNEFKSVHGVRCLSALALLMAHKTMALLYNPYINRTWMTETQAMNWSVIGRNAIIYTDCFLLISGLLNASALFSDLDKKEQKIKFKEKVMNRLCRIVPSLITVILFCTYILPHMGSGPLWPLVINHHSVLCRKYMWRNALLIHNYYGFENMCLTHTHQLGIDMQLFLITPVFVYLIWKFKSRGLYIVMCVALCSTGLRFWKTLEHNLSHVVHFGIPISRMFDTANFSYILPTHRATIYLIGIILAYFLRNVNNTKSFSKKQLICIWTIVYIVGLMTWFGPVTMSVKGYKYKRLQAAIYGALSPITWGTAVAWVIYTTERGIHSWFTPVLTWKYFQIFTKIAYGVYLVQFPVFFYNVGVTRHVGEFNNYMMLPPLEIGVILLISTALTLCIEMPFQNMYKLFKNSK